MSRKSLLILLVLALIIGAAAWFTRDAGKSSKADTAALAPGQKLLTGIDGSKISTVTIRSGDETVTLKKGTDDVWSVAERDGYTADAEVLSRLLQNLFNLKIGQAQEAGPSQYPRLQLASPDDKDEKLSKDQKGTAIQLRDNNNALISELIIGKAPQSEAQNPMAALGGGGGGATGRFVRLPGDASRVFLVPDTLDAASGNPAGWIDKTFYTPDAAKRVVIADAEGFKGWEASRESAQASFALKDAPSGKQLAQTVAASLGYLLGASTPDDVLSKAERDALDRKQSRVLTFETFDGFTYKVTLTPLSTEPAAGNAAYALEAEVTGNYKDPAPAPGSKNPGEMNEEEKKTADANKLAHKSVWDSKLAREQKLGERAFKVSAYSFDAVLKPLDEVLENIPAPPPAAGDTPPDMLTLPPNAPAVPGATPPATITTPPVEVPAASPEDTKKPEAAPAPGPAATESIDETEPLPSR